MRGRSVALAGVAVLLTACGDDPSALPDCSVELVEDDRLGTCDEIDGTADLPDLTLPCLGSRTEASMAAIGGPAVVNFWASWCGPCREEMPILEDFHQQYGDRVAVVGVAIDKYPGAAADFAADRGVTYPSLLDGCESIAETDLVMTALPQFVFVAEDGSVSQVAGGVESVRELVELAEDELGVRLAPEPA